MLGARFPGWRFLPKVRIMRNVSVFSLCVLVQLAASSALAETPRDRDAYERSRVGDQGPNRIVVPTNQVLSPVGRQVAYDGRPVDMALSPDGRWLAVLDRASVLLVDPAEGKVVSTARQKGGSYAGIAFARDGRHVYASSITGTIGVFEVE